jgi:hypothetical protein
MENKAIKVIKATTFQEFKDKATSLKKSSSGKKDSKNLKIIFNL